VADTGPVAMLTVHIVCFSLVAFCNVVHCAYASLAKSCSEMSDSSVSCEPRQAAYLCKVPGSHRFKVFVIDFSFQIICFRIAVIHAIKKRFIL